MEHMKKHLDHRRYITIFTLILIIAMACAGCAEAAVSETGEATPAATPSPTPKEGVKAVFGSRQITITAISNGSEEDSTLFFEGARAEAQSLGIALNTDAAENDFGGAVSDAVKTSDAIIACFLGRQFSYTVLGPAIGTIPVAVYETQKGGVPKGVSHIYYTPDNEVELAFDAALTYPPHDTPVRLILMFESTDTESYLLYQQLYDEGRIFPKEIYIASKEEQTAGEWLTEKLDDYIEGMLDGVYAGDTALALNALDAIEALERTDMEVFCPGVTAETVERMEKDPDVFAQTAGANMYLAGALSVRAALKELKGEGSVTLELQPVVINASDLTENGVQALADFYGETAATWNEDWMDYLREYYGTIPN
jgi:hypothetical protein